MFDVYSRWSKCKSVAFNFENWNSEQNSFHIQMHSAHTHTHPSSHPASRVLHSKQTHQLRGISQRSCAKFIDELFTCFSWAIFLWRREYVDGLAVSCSHSRHCLRQQFLVINNFLCVCIRHSLFVDASPVSVHIYVNVSVSIFWFCWFFFLVFLSLFYARMCCVFSFFFLSSSSFLYIVFLCKLHPT